MDATVLWPDGLNPEKVFEHYGYVNNPNMFKGFWENNGTVLEKLKRLPDILDPTQKIRIVFEYDPDFPRALLFVGGVKRPTIQSVYKGSLLGKQGKSKNLLVLPRKSQQLPDLSLQKFHER